MQDFVSAESLHSPVDDEVAIQAAQADRERARQSAKVADQPARRAPSSSSDLAVPADVEDAVSQAIVAPRARVSGLPASRVATFPPLHPRRASAAGAASPVPMVGISPAVVASPASGVAAAPPVVVASPPAVVPSARALRSAVARAVHARLSDEPIRTTSPSVPIRLIRNVFQTMRRKQKHSTSEEDAEASDAPTDEEEGADVVEEEEGSASQVSNSNPINEGVVDWVPVAKVLPC